MVHYKLTYFDARGLGEVCRQLFYLADVEYEDNRITPEEFAKMKPNLPSGQVPILEIDGLVISQSAAIMRYLARKFGYAGKTPIEEAQVDGVIDLFKEFIYIFRQLGFALLTGKPETELDRIKAEVVKPAAQVYLSNLKKILEKSKSGYLVGNGLTWADLQVADNLTSLKNVDMFEASEEKLLETFHQKILETPKLKEYLDKRSFSLI